MLTVDYLENASQILRQVGNRLEGKSVALLGYAYGWTGEFDRSFHLFSEALDASNTYGDRSIETASYFWGGCARYFKGEWRLAV